jgi:hypothetical protein
LNPAGTFIHTLFRADSTAIAARLAADAVFHSPVTDYEGKATAAAVLSAVARVITETTVEVELAEGPHTVAIVRGRVSGEPVDGAVWVRMDGHGAVAEVTLMLRPLEALLAGVEEMKQLLSAPPADVKPASS